MYLMLSGLVKRLFGGPAFFLRSSFSPPGPVGLILDGILMYAFQPKVARLGTPVVSGKERHYFVFKKPLFYL